MHTAVLGTSYRYLVRPFGFLAEISTPTSGTSNASLGTEYFVLTTGSGSQRSNERILRPRDDKACRPIPDQVGDRARLAHEPVHAEQDRDSFHRHHAHRRERAREHDEPRA